EDIIINQLLGNKKSGFYIDVGAYDPSRFNNTKRFYERGISYYEKGEYEKALPELENALIWQPENTETENKINEATRMLDILVRGQFVQERIEKAYSMYRKNDMLNSLSEWLVILDFEPRNPKAKEYVRKITDTLDEKQKEQSQKELLERKQELVTQLMKQGNNYLYQKKYKEAIGEWEKILKIDSDNQTVKQNIETTKNNIKFIAQNLFEEGLNFFNTYEYSRAIEKFNSALSVDPQHEKAIEFLVRAKMKADIVNKKINTKEIENLYYHAADYYMNGQYNEAKENLNKILKYDPANENAHKLLAKINSILVVLQQNK
ncbi:MAG: tetratricopeptide repeat protein, partial [Elusimicrobiota bacterium]|nr:tetratricopeptide repeat protein [Elusimicrobiota bacterium]